MARKADETRVTFADLEQAVKGRKAALAVRLASQLEPLRRDRESGEVPLHWAAERGLAKVVAALAKRAKRIDAFDGDGRTALHHAVESGDLATVRALLAAGASPDVWNRSEGQVLLGTALHFACERGDPKLV